MGLARGLVLASHHVVICSSWPLLTQSFYHVNLVFAPLSQYYPMIAKK